MPKIGKIMKKPYVQCMEMFPFSARQYQAVVDGKLVSGVADNVAELNGKRVAIEAKWVKGDWNKSIKNPAGSIGTKPFARKAQDTMLGQARKYSAAFDEVVYHSNSTELIEYYKAVFEKEGLENIKFIHSP